MEFGFTRAAVDRDGARANLAASLERHGASIEDLTKLSLELGRGSPVFVAGSVIDGYANLYSDIDLFAVTTEGVPLDTHVCRLNTVRVDMETRPRSEFLRLAGLFVHATNLAQMHQIYRDVTLATAHRLVTALPLSGANEIAEIQSALPATLFQLYLIRHRSGATDNDLQDSIGALRTDDLEYAFLRARDAIGHSSEAALALAGDLNPMSKYLVKRLRRFFGAEHPLYDRFVRYNSAWSQDRRELVRQIEAMLRDARRTLNVVEKEIWRSPLAIFEVTTDSPHHPDPS